ncbi:MAG TPA: hypothetical protein VKY74_21155, partial [Chloroflexia bacterium]|nr:hypothetical protein [Chloroflexia bacterium]
MLHIDHIPVGAVGRVLGRWIGPFLAVGLAAALLLGAAVATRQVYGKPHLSGYVPGRDGSARLVTVSSAAPGPGVAPAAPAGPRASLQVLANGNYSAVPAGIDAATPYGPPVARTDWIITKDYAAHGGHSNAGAVDIAFNHDYQAFGAPVVATQAGRVKLL